MVKLQFHSQERANQTELKLMGVYRLYFIFTVTFVPYSVYIHVFQYCLDQYV